jgi:tetratricopeptide (TPR) repeat protein
MKDKYQDTYLDSFNKEVTYYFQRTIRLSQKKAHIFLAYIHASLNEEEEALFIAEEYYPEISCYTSWQKGYDLLFCGQTYLKLKRIDRAIHYFNLAIDYANDSNYTQVMAKGILGFAMIHRYSNNLQASLSSNLEVIKLLKVIKAKPDLAEAYFQLGLTYQAMGEHDQAEEYKAKALELFAQMEAPKQIERVNKTFGDNIQ